MKKRTWVIGGVVLAAILIVVIALVLLPSGGQGQHATVVETINQVGAHPRPADTWQPAAVAMVIYGGGQVRTGSDSRARLELPEGIVRLAADTVFTVKESITRRGRALTTLSLQEGRLWVSLTTGQPHEFTVETGNAVAAVRDSRFSVKVAAGETLVSVAEGTAVLTAQGQSVTVAAGQQATVQVGQPPAPLEPLSAEERTLWATEGEMPEMAPPTPTPTQTPTPTRAPSATPAPSKTPAPSIMASPIAQTTAGPTATATTSTPAATPAARATPRPICRAPASWRIYIVQNGDTLTSLAVQHGTTVAATVDANCLSTTTIYSGQRLYLPPVAVPPPPPPTTCVPQPPTRWALYTAQSGDSLYGLAQRFQTTLLQIQQANCLSGYDVTVGQQLYLPPVPPTPTATWTLIATATNTPTATTTPTDTATSTSTPTATNTPIATTAPTYTPTNTSAPKATNTPTATATPTVPLDTPTPMLTPIA